MNRKRFLNAALVAIFACGLSLVTASCSDDKESSEEEQQQKDEQQAEADLDQAAEFWNVVGQLTDDPMPDDWQHATYAPSIGEPDGENATVRIVPTGDVETAAARFAQLTGANVNADTRDYTYHSDAVGTLKYHRTDGASLATVDVDIPQMPSLTQIIYQTPEQMGGNGKFNGTAYYRFGDVVKKNNSDGSEDYWICVRPAFGPAGKGDSHWITVSKVPAANVKDVTKIINKQKVIHHLPKSLSTNREHMQNLAEMLYAMTNPTKWADNLATNDGYKTLKYFRDFNYKEVFKYNDDKFFNDVAEKWEKKGLFKEIFGMSREQLKAELESTGLNLVYSSATMSGNKIVLPLATYYNTNLKTEVLSKSNSEWTTQFDIQEMMKKKRYIEYKDIAGHQLKGWLVRYATGATLCKGSVDKVVSDKYKKLTNCQDYFVYNRDVLNMSMKDSDLKNTSPGVFGKGGDLGYYTTGDIVKYNNRYYVCASKHGKNGTARFITLNDQDSHSTMSFEWSGIGEKDGSTFYDVVYSDDMASTETLTNWVANILMDDDMNSSIREVMNKIGASESIKMIVPKTEEDRLEYINALFSTANYLTYMNKPWGEGGMHVSIYWWANFFEADDDSPDVDVMLYAPNTYLLADKMRYSTHINEHTDHWVPYIVLHKDNDLYNTNMKIILDADESQTTISPSHFHWEDMGVFNYKGTKVSSMTGKSYHILKLGMYWVHESAVWGQQDMYTDMIFDFTKDWLEHPDPMTRKECTDRPNSWRNRCVTSRELTFQDTGVKNSKCESVWVTKER